ncbi:MAG: diguanylate cyclase [Capsulimonadales bacterium]|nr:diguanylate cyclase [Capsulimonadales bacterium]
MFNFSIARNNHSPTPEARRREEIDRMIDQATASQHTDRDAAAHLIEEAIEGAKRLGYDSALGNALRVRANLALFVGRTTEAAGDYLNALEIARTVGDRRSEARCLQNLGLISFREGGYGAAIEHSLKAIPIWREIGDPVGLGKGLCNLAGYLSNQGHFAESLIYQEEALENAYAAQDDELIGMTLVNLGHTYYQMERWDEARQRFEASIRHLETGLPSANLPTAFAMALTNLAATYLRLGQPEVALPIAKRALVTATATGDSAARILPLVNLGEVFDAVGDTLSAEKLLRKSLNEARSLPSPADVVDPLISIATYHLKYGRVQEAKTILAEALRTEAEEERPHFLARIHSLRSQIAEAEGDYRAAFEAYREFRDLERLRDQERARVLLAFRLAKLEVSYGRRDAELLRERAMELAKLNAEKDQALRELARRLNEDVGTGAFNRRYLFEWLESAMTPRDPQATPVAAIADLDNFREVNDRFSYRVGDSVLRTVARIFQMNVRETDLVARYGAGEFALIFPDMPLSEARNVCERLREEVERYPWDDIHPELRVTVSIGIADAPGASPEALLNTADKRLYDAKNSGKNRVV